MLSPATLPPPPTTPSPIKWKSAAPSSWSSDTPILTIQLTSSSGTPTSFCWHRRGDYLASVCKVKSSLCSYFNTHVYFKATGGTQGGVWIHQITKRHSLAPFTKIKGTVQSVLFHPVKPHFFVAVRISILHLISSELSLRRHNNTYDYITWRSRN